MNNENTLHTRVVKQISDAIGDNKPSVHVEFDTSESEIVVSSVMRLVAEYFTVDCLDAYNYTVKIQVYVPAIPTPWF